VARGLLVELSPNEEIALQRIARGVMHTPDMEARHLARLKQLGLIEESGTDFKLTELGRTRLVRRGAQSQKAGRGTL
jgi:predicted transcriptional regulator